MTSIKKRSILKKKKKMSKKCGLKCKINNTKQSKKKERKKVRRTVKNHSKNHNKNHNKKTSKKIVKKNINQKVKISKLIKKDNNMSGGSGRQLNELMNRCYEFFDYQNKRSSRRVQYKLNYKKRHLKSKFRQNIRKSRQFIKRLKLYRNDIIREKYPHREDIEEYLTIIDILSLFRNTEQIKDVENKYKFSDFIMTNEFYKHLKIIYNSYNFEFAIKALSDRKTFKEFNESIKMIDALLKNIERMDVLQFCQITQNYRNYNQRSNYSGNYYGDYGNYGNYGNYNISYI